MSVVYTCILLSMLRGLFGGPLLQRQGELVGAQWWMWCIKRNLYTSDPSVKRERQSEAQIFLAWMAVYACFSLYWTHVWHHSTINRLRRRLLGCSEKRKDGSGTDEENGYRRRRRRGCLCDDSAWKHTKVGKVVHKLLYSKNIAIWATSTFGLVNAWLTLADLIITRNQVHRLAGEKFEDDELGYGQIVAALLWLPVVVEYGYIFSCEYHPSWSIHTVVLMTYISFTVGAKRGLRGRLPTTYTAVRIRDSGLHEMHHEKWYEREQRWVAEVRERSNSSMSITSIELPLHRTSTYRPSVGDWNAQVSAASEDALVGGGGGYLYGEPVGVAVGGEDGFYRTYGEWETPDAESEDRYGYGGEHDGEQSGR